MLYQNNPYLICVSTAICCTERLRCKHNDLGWGVNEDCAECDETRLTLGNVVECTRCGNDTNELGRDRRIEEAYEAETDAQVAAYENSPGGNCAGCGATQRPFTQCLNCGSPVNPSNEKVFFFVDNWYTAEQIEYQHMILEDDTHVDATEELEEDLRRIEAYEAETTAEAYAYENDPLHTFTP